LFQFLFYRLLLAHLLGEFSLQTTKISQFKMRNFLGVFIHSIIYTLLVLIFCIPALNKFWPFIIIIGISHLIIDQGKISLTRYLKKDNLLMFFLEQILQLGVIYLLLIIGKTAKYPPLTPYQLPETITISFESFLKLFLYTYYDNRTIVYYIGFCISIFATSFLIYYLEKIILPKEEQLLIGSYRELFGFIERGLITVFALKGLIVYIIIYTIIRFGICTVQKLLINKDFTWRLLIWDTILNIILASFYGYMINWWIKTLS
jgi:hypothetical protein